MYQQKAARNLPRPSRGIHRLANKDKQIHNLKKRLKINIINLNLTFETIFIEN